MANHNNNNAVAERQRGQRPEHSPRDVNGERHEPGTVDDGDNDDSTHNEGGTFGNGVKAAFKEAENLLSPNLATVLPQMIQGQRHGIVEQRKGAQRVDEAGNVVGATELWRCQCGVKFQGRTSIETESLALDHLRKYDPDVPRD